MSGEDTCPVCNGGLSGDQKCHNPKCRASEEFWGIKSKPNFEMAHSDNPEEIILATQRSLVDAMRGVIKDLRADKNALGKQPGLTWEQLDYFLESFRERTPKIIHQGAPI